MDRLPKNSADVLCKLTTILFLTLITNVSSSFDIKFIAENLSQDIMGIKNKELGVSFISEFYNNFKYISASSEVHDDVEAMAQKLNNTINEVFLSLNNAQLMLEEMVYNSTSDLYTLVPCQLQKNSDLDAGGPFDNEINNHYILRSNKQKMGSIRHAIKQQYIITDINNTQTKFSPFSTCKEHDDTLLWKNYIKRNKYTKKNVILLLDHGGSLSKKQLLIVKAIAKEIVNLLNETDRIALIGITEELISPNPDCFKSKNQLKPLNITPTLQYASASHKYNLFKFIDSLKRGHGATNHTLGIESALQIILNKTADPQDSIMILYVSRGLLSSLTEAKIVLQAIERYSSVVNSSFIINTCAVIDESKSVMYETDFLRDIAEQNYDKYVIPHKNKPVNAGLMLAINSTNSVGYAVALFYEMFNPQRLFSEEQRVSLPAYDTVTKDLSVSFTIGGNFLENHFSVLGVDVYFSNIAEDVTYYSSNQQHSYAFLLDTTGLVLMHPSYPRPSTVNHQISFIDIGRLEKIPDIDNFKVKLLSEEKGEYISSQGNTTNVRKYVWKRVGQWYIICVAIRNKYGSRSWPFRASLHPSASNTKLFYQNLDSFHDYKLCKHFIQLTTKDVPSLYLSMSCFNSPFHALRTTQDKSLAQGYWAYLKDETRLLANPGLKKGVRDEVVALNHIMEFLRKQHLTSLLSKYIVRRYATSFSGVLQMFPGGVVGSVLEPTKRSWFLRAIQHQEENTSRVVFVPPYLDSSGAGYIVTMAYATAQTVVAVDLTYGYLYRMMLEYMPFCIDDKITCFLMDDHGYLIYHPSLMVINEARPAIEQKHIVHKETLVANDILNHKHFIRKLLCNNYSNNTIQRYYRLNTSFTDVLANYVPGEHCVTYRITSVPNTNIFVGVVNATCDGVPTFCPCSVVDRLCLNCNRMEQKECECPCECPLNVHDQTCPNVNQNITDNVPCLWYSDEDDVSLEAATFHSDSDISNFENCFPVNCQVEQTYLDCLGLTGCEWCKYDIDGNYLGKPFCTSISACFNGVFGSVTPYKEYNSNLLSDPVNTDLSPVGPILGSVIAMCILFILLFVCYRSYTTPSTERLYLSSTQDNHLRMSDLNVNDNYHDLGHNHRDKLLEEDTGGTNRADRVMSPYCVVAVANTYRRGASRAANTADSDHGYSTMTPPHEESDHFSLAPKPRRAIELDSLEDDSNDFTSDNASVRTSVSLNTPNQGKQMFTQLNPKKNPNSIVVPVTVHTSRMDAS